MPKGNVKPLEKELLFSKTKVRIKINLDRWSNNNAANDNRTAYNVSERIHKLHDLIIKKRSNQFL